jgi:hypothetical protein
VLNKLSVCRQALRWLTWVTVSFLIVISAEAQSTFGTFVGTVHDPSGAVVGGATVQITNQGTSTQRSVKTDSSGSYSIVNVEPGNYEVVFEAPGFQRTTYSNIALTAREAVRVDGALSLTAQSQAVSVAATAAPITTDASNLAEIQTGRELNDLPVAVASRASGSTSPYQTFALQTGVQTDQNGQISVAGTKPSMISYSLDGISNADTRGINGAAPILTELYPSFSSIDEIRVSEVGNSAEYGGVSDITLISKGGTNEVHGGFFENLQNTDFNARNTFSPTVPQEVMNDFGVSIGGPVVLPHIYNGHNKTFFFATYEGLRLAQQSVLVENVPSLALRQGDLSYYGGPITNGAGVPFANNQIPASMISPVAQKVLQYLFPLPNAIGPNPVTNNFVDNFPSPITSNQGDIRLDQNFGSRQSFFARLTYKRRLSILPPGGGFGGAFEIGPTYSPANDFNLTLAYNFVITPTIVNEFRFGVSTEHSDSQINYLSQDAAADLFGIPAPRPLAIGGGVPNIMINGFQSTGGGGVGSSWARTGTDQVTDNITVIRGNHTAKFGGDYRHLTGFYNNVWNGFRLGWYFFNGSVTNFGNPAADPYAAFLLGYPDETDLVEVTSPNMEAYANHYAFYGQDDWKINSRFTLNYGLRWEYHPSFYDSLGNLTGFLPNYTSTYQGQTIRGAIVVPNQGLQNVDPLFAQSVFPMPILTATQAGIPQNMRFSQRTDFAPRIGFAWRPFNDNKTVIRGGYGRYIETLLGGIASLGWGLATANNGFYVNSIGPNGLPTLQFPAPWPSNLAQPGSQSLADITDLHLRDPYVQEWNLTVERDLGFNMGLRLSYDGNHGSALQEMHDINALPANTQGYFAVASEVPYPEVGYSPILTNGAISNYNAMTIQLTKRMSNGLQLSASYVFARNLSNDGGVASNGFPGEYGGIVTTPFNPGDTLDYGNVSYTRRNRFLGTFVYDLPFGKGKLLGTNAGTALDRLIGGWELAGVLLFESGPFLTVTAPGTDPSGTGFDLYNSGRADIVSGVPLYPANRNIYNWINAASLTLPPNNTGTWPTEGVGMFVGPGTQAVSLSLFKAVPIKERVRAQIGAAATNVLNHPNYGIPNTQLGTPGFGTINSLQGGGEGSGPRSLQLTARLTF